MIETAIDHIARSTMDAHERVCTERYGSLWKAASDLKDDVAEIKRMMWHMLIGVTGISVLGVIALVFLVITKGVKL